MITSFEEVIQYYRTNENSSNSFHSATRNLSPIKKWLEDQLKINDVKSNSKSSLIRKEGNESFKKKNLRQTLRSYNASICCAPDSSEEYFLAFANRSAVTFELGKYEDCLKDIDSCLNSCNYPMTLRPKLQKRKVECLKKLELLEKISIENLSLAESNEKVSGANMSMYYLPSLDENPNFAYASSKVEMRYNQQKGRHVVAKQNISKGDIIFLEKSFAFGSIFDEQTRTLSMLKCYNCLKNIYSGIPCKSCIKCIFCDSECRHKSWEETHRWECQGMIGDIWYHLGSAFPAFRALLKGINSGFKEVEMNKVKCFGNKVDNYPYFNSLIFKKNRPLDVSIMSATVILYLKEYTNFFDWFLSQQENSSWSQESIMIFLENQLSKHILQIQNNSSIIEHWHEEELLPFDKEPVACGIFPSVSMMNHSCKPNITNYFVCDTIVVKALEDLKINDEIYNCYGIYYRHLSKNKRQKVCLQLYNFKCRCQICSDPDKEMDAFDLFICCNCGFDIPRTNMNYTICRICGIIIDYRKLRDMYNNIDHQLITTYLSNSENVELLQSSLVTLEKILNKYHKDLQFIYFRLYQFHRKTGNNEKMLKYFQEWLKGEKIKVGQDIQPFGEYLYELGSFLISKCSTTKDKHMILKAQDLLTEAKRICSLHYPSYIINRRQWDSK